MPRYRLTQRAYINDQLLEPGAEIGEGTSVPFTGVPGPHMDAVDKAAEKAMKEARVDEMQIDPFQYIDISKPDPALSDAASG